MFGGIESTSFKIKFKQINRRGKAIVELLEKITYPQGAYNETPSLKYY